MDTPFGYLLAPNITPDPETGIGRWSSDDFYRAMHDGVNKRGQDMFPVMPFDFYTKVTREDSDAIYAYLRTRETRAQRRGHQSPAISVQPALVDGGVARAVLQRRHVQAGSDQDRDVESRRLSRRGARPLQLVPFAAQCAGRNRKGQGVHRRDDRRLVRAESHVEPAHGPRQLDGRGNRDLPQNRCDQGQDDDVRPDGRSRAKQPAVI